MKKVLICLADGFEEIEAIVPIDLMRRAGMHVVLAGVGASTVTGSRGVSIISDGELADFTIETFDAVMLPGGMPGASNLAASWEVNERVIAMFNEGSWSLRSVQPLQWYSGLQASSKAAGRPVTRGLNPMLREYGSSRNRWSSMGISSRRRDRGLPRSSPLR